MTFQEIMAFADEMTTIPAYSAEYIGCRFDPREPEDTGCILVTETRRDIIVKALRFYAVNFK